MDECDLGSISTEQDLARTIAAVRAQAAGGEKIFECVDCGDKIPAKRREAAPGCERCVVCQETFERRGHGG